mmetsp:Transcript_15816/g.28152  ORF Transcript_15816/g.28152 Transcript_15816/m.28152 type:complete len:220 (-) Transcript_15816:1941-2600(-)
MMPVLGTRIFEEDGGEDESENLPPGELGLPSGGSIGFPRLRQFSIMSDRSGLDENDGNFIFSGGEGEEVERGSCSKPGGGGTAAAGGNASPRGLSKPGGGLIEVASGDERAGRLCGLKEGDPFGPSDLDLTNDPRASLVAPREFRRLREHALGDAGPSEGSSSWRSWDIVWFVARFMSSSSCRETRSCHSRDAGLYLSAVSFKKGLNSLSWAQVSKMKL